MLVADAAVQHDLVIFDCDGVLVDSEPIANRVLSERLATLGLRMSPDEVMGAFISRTRQGCLERAAALLGGPLPRSFAEEWDAALFQAFDAELRPVAGIGELLDGLAVPYCVASNSSRERMQVALAAAGLLARFTGRMFSAAEVARPKPAPDLFLHAARAMGVAPARCAVIEDTPTGVRAAAAAGMRVFAYAGAAHADVGALRAAGGSVFADMRLLAGLLA
jgi:HAD superfamily hydrolase (TIGR01509 family)